MYKKNIITAFKGFLWMFLIVICFEGKSFADVDIQEAPLNPAFVEFQKNPNALLQGSGDAGFGLGYIPSPIAPEIHKPRQSENSTININGASPSDPKYDLRDPNLDGNFSDSLLTPVRNQGSCGSCWTFATYGSMESYLKKAFNLSDAANDYSEDNLKHRHGFDLGPCDGGNMFMSTAYLSRNDGPITELDDPYNESPTSEYCTSCKPARYVDNVVFMPVRSGVSDNLYIKEAILQYGALYTSMYFDSFYYNEVNRTYYYDGPPGGGNHAVVIIGWDNNKTVAGSPGNGAFIVRNSWGTNWGEGGYFYVSYYDTVFAFEALAYFADKDNSQSDFDVIYQYDPLGFTTAVGCDGRVDWGANIFMPKEDGQLTAVGFYATASNLSYTVTIYDSFSGGQFSSILASQSGSMQYSGYYTVKLASPVTVHQNDDFAVVIKFDTSATGYNYPIPIEGPSDNYSSTAIANPGESYFSCDGSGFIDITSVGFSNTNVCIKAMVKTGSSHQPAEMISPKPESTLISTTVTFTWTNVSAEKYRLEIGNSVGSSDLYGEDRGTNTSATVSGLPSDGRKLYVRLKSSFGGTWLDKDYTYTAYTSSGGQKAVMISPTEGSTLISTSVTFTWTTGDASSYRIDVGNSSGASDIREGTPLTSTSQVVSGLPNDGRKLYVRLWSLMSGGWDYNDYTYTAVTSSDDGDVRMISPTPGSTLPSTSVIFTWSGGDADRFWIYIGTSKAGSTDIYSKDQGTNTSVLIPGLPDNGIKLYVRLWWLSGGLWQYEDYTYTAFKSAGTKEPGVIITPAPGTTLTSTTVTFTWTGSASRYWLYIGTSEKGSDIYAKDQGTSTSATVSALPGNGAKLYVRLWSLIDGYWQYYDCFYTAFSTPDSVKPAEMITPIPDSTLTATSVTFTWTKSGADRYWLYIGTSSAGGTDIYAKDQGTNTSVAVSGLPNNGTKVYVRLWSLVSGKWVYKDYTYTAFKAPDSKVPAEILTPAPGTALTSTSVTFTWGSTGATKYWLYVGTSGVGTSNVYSKDQGTNTSATVSNLPRNKVKLYVRLWSLVSGSWLYKDYTYTSAP